MNSQYKKIIKLFIGLIITLFNSCVKQPDPNPCADKKPVTASFKIYESGLVFGQNRIKIREPYETDTVLTKEASFVADQDTIGGTTYLWEIGDAKYAGREITVDFSGRSKGDDRIPIKLTVSSKTNTSCFPDDDGIDSFTKLLVLVGENTLKYSDGWTYEKSLLLGTYTGYLNNNKLDTLIIDRDCPYAKSPYGNINLICLPNPYDSTSYFEVVAKYSWVKRDVIRYDAFIGYKQAVDENGSFLTKLQPNNNTIIMKYYDKVFNGTRIKP